MQRSDIEIMAPVGSYETLMAAIQGNANAVYFGIGKLNMRAKSTLNFTENDLKNIVQICRDNNLRSYVTLNTVMYDGDIDEMHHVIDVVKDSGVDAIIASDHAALMYAREKGVEIHISTQQNISNFEAVRFFSQFADVMVLARELNLDQMAEIARKIDEHNITGPSGNKVKLEIFTHGALCMAVSGKCYLSLHEYNYSANRGACLQICRRAYNVTDKETGAQLEIDNEYIMSPKDLCTIDFLDRIIGAGIKILKIEGRARSGEYVKTVCQCYNEAVHSIVDQSFSKEKIDAWKSRLSTVYNRGFWDGYYLGRKMGEWSEIYGSKATKTKEYLAKVTNFYSNIGVGEFQMETGSLKIGDEVLILGPTTGVVEIAIVEEIRVDLKPVNETIKGQLFSMKVNTTIRRNDKLYKLKQN